jgi:hypothetical protein
MVETKRQAVRSLSKSLLNAIPDRIAWTLPTALHQVECGDTHGQGIRLALAHLTSWMG